ncbi:MAG TPA: hypothetical protein VGC36_01530 [Rhizomicrobium sp.]
MTFRALTGPALAVTAVLFLTAAAHAQSTPVTGTTNSTGTSGRMWGAAGAAGSGQDSSAMHNLDANSAALVNAARLGLLTSSGTGSTITAIGSQSIVSTTIIGDANTTNVSATQSATNSGSVTNSGSIATR